MSWLRRLVNPDQAPGRTKGTQDCLIKAGWSAGRRCDLTSVQEQLEGEGFPFHDAARIFLTEYFDLAAGLKVHATRFADEVRNAKSHRPLTKEEVGKKVHAKMVEAFEKGESSMAKRGGRGVPDLNTVVRNIKAFAAVKNS